MLKLYAKQTCDLMEIRLLTSNRKCAFWTQQLWMCGSPTCRYVASISGVDRSGDRVVDVLDCVTGLLVDRGVFVAGIFEKR